MLDVLLVLLCTAALAWNTFRHDYHIGYDIAAHLNYAKTLAQGRLPTMVDSTEFFTPPLAYVPSALAYAMGGGRSDDLAARVWQGMQVVCGGVVLVVALRAVRNLPAFADVVLALLIVGNAAWWRSFAMLRPEALLAAVMALAVWQTGKLFGGRREGWRFAVTGGLWGLACLSRQWAIPALLGVVLATPLATNLCRRWWAGIAVSAGCCAIVAAPFYLHLKFRHGSASAFNVPPGESPRLSWAWRPTAVVGTPLTPDLNMQPLNILTADWAGDYWLYYLVAGKTRSNNYLCGSRLLTAIDRPPKGFVHNRPDVLPAIRRSVAIGVFLLPAVLLGFAAFVVATVRDRTKGVPRGDDTVIVAAVIAGLIGYGWFVVNYSAAGATGDTVKATYLVPLWPWIAVAATHTTMTLLRQRTLAWAIAAIGLAIILVFTAPTWFSRFPAIP